jgi:hypothetical protein
MWYLQGNNGRPTRGPKKEYTFSLKPFDWADGFHFHGIRQPILFYRATMDLISKVMK